jgi:GAF domain-containing protein
MAKVVSLPVSPDGRLAIPLFDGALLHVVPCRETPHVMVALYGPRGGDAGGVVLHADRAALLGRWLERLAVGKGARPAPAAVDGPPSPDRLDALVDPETVASTLAAIAVPRFADWWALDVIAPRGRLRRLAVGHADPARAVEARGLRRYPPDPRAAHPRAEVLRTGRPNVAHELHDDRIVAAARSREHLAIMRSLGCRSSLVVPLKVRRRVLGIMTFSTAESGRRYDDGHVAAATAFADQAAVALGNASAYARAQAALRRVSARRRPGGRLS